MLWKSCHHLLQITPGWLYLGDSEGDGSAFLPRGICIIYP